MSKIENILEKIDNRAWEIRSEFRSSDKISVGVANAWQQHKERIHEAYRVDVRHCDPCDIWLNSDWKMCPKCGEEPPAHPLLEYVQRHCRSCQLNWEIAYASCPIDAYQLATGLGKRQVA